MKTEFNSFDDAFERLSVFQTFDTKLPNEKDVGKFDKELDASTKDILKKMSQIESTLESHQQGAEDKTTYEEIVTLERLACQHSLSELKQLREERGKQLKPERLLCLVHGLDESQILQQEP
eukprot:CAMPEP_0170170704 /NCGR_PEP_ID=MMETSP0040_2-20121228/3712_1 /TAXON_ID=641309 /ORGANISM="Lotharella oceanica, Strain CCMP622" /LENGTH=120 /DNA_ID=CAMNT_0010410265 /DNA_START=159 /DNA_END=521 /DNA_ORIENTATION=-